MKKQIIFPAVFLAIAAISVLGLSSASAQDTTNHKTELIQKLADKFHLNKDEVEGVFDTDRQEMHTRMQTNLKSKLSQDVKDGKITEAQKTLIVNKMKELETKRETNINSNLTPEQRKTQMQTERNNLEDWATQNNIDLKGLMLGREMKMGFGWHHQ